MRVAASLYAAVRSTWACGGGGVGRVDRPEHHAGRESGDRASRAHSQVPGDDGGPGVGDRLAAQDREGAGRPEIHRGRRACADDCLTAKTDITAMSARPTAIPTARSELRAGRRKPTIIFDRISSLFLVVASVHMVMPSDAVSARLNVRGESRALVKKADPCTPGRGWSSFMRLPQTRP